MSEVDIRLEDVWKQYRLGTSRSADRFWAIRSLSLDVERSATVGIIGPNGAGKSTLLKLLAGITAPTRGVITIVGVLSALIEVGSGFHPELTGRENVFLSGAILGLRRREIAARLDQIVAFAGVERFIDTPVKWYSSGMYVRLGFAVAAHLRPHILLVDEVLAVGDAEFQSRCLQRIRELRQQGVTIVFISHDLTTVEQLCDSAVLLEHGNKVAEGTPTDVVALYHRHVVAAQASVDNDGAAAPDAALKLTNLTFHSGRPAGDGVFRSGDAAVIRLRFETTVRRVDVHFEVSIYSPDGRTLYGTLSTGAAVTVDSPGGVVEFAVPSLPLIAGAYYVGAVVRDGRTSHPIDWWDGGSTLYVESSGAAVAGHVFIPHSARVVSLVAKPPDAAADLQVGRVWRT